METCDNDDLFISDEINEDGLVEFCATMGYGGYGGFAMANNQDAIDIIKHLSRVFDIDLKNIGE